MYATPLRLDQSSHAGLAAKPPPATIAISCQLLQHADQMLTVRIRPHSGGWPPV